MSDSPTITSMNDRPLIRFGVTFLANGVGSAVALVSGIIVARALQVKAYGDLSFLTSSFGNLLAFLDLGTSMAFFTFLSQKRRGRHFMLLYFGWLILQAGLVGPAIAWFLPSKIINHVWLGYERGLLLLALGATFLMGQGWTTVVHLGEARRKTVWIQGAELAQTLFHFLLLCLAVLWKVFSVRFILWIWILEYSVMTLVLAPPLIKQNLAEGPEDEKEPVRNVLNRYWEFCRPLAIATNFSYLCLFLDRWLLQRYGGAAQQGFYAVGIQSTIISGLATASILKIFWKEIAEAHEQKNRDRMERLYTMVSRLLYFISAWCACLIIPYCSDLLRLTVGASYSGGWLCFSLLLLYPVHNCLGRIEGSLLYAIGDTKSFMKTSILLETLGIPVSYFLLAPATARIPGLGLGANGLSYKMVLSQVVSVNFLGYIIARINGWRFRFGYQIGVLGLLLTLGLISKWISTWLMGLWGRTGTPIPMILMGGCFYGLVSLPLVYCVPALAGLSDADIGRILKDSLQYARAWFPI